MRYHVLLSVASLSSLATIESVLEGVATVVSVTPADSAQPVVVAAAPKPAVVKSPQPPRQAHPIVRGMTIRGLFENHMRTSGPQTRKQLRRLARKFGYADNTTQNTLYSMISDGRVAKVPDTYPAQYRVVA
jgi:hypothetical protein